MNTAAVAEAVTTTTIRTRDSTAARVVVAAATAGKTTAVETNLAIKDSKDPRAALVGDKITMKVREEDMVADEVEATTTNHHAIMADVTTRVATDVKKGMAMSARMRAVRREDMVAAPVVKVVMEAVAMGAALAEATIQALAVVMAVVLVEVTEAALLTSTKTKYCVMRNRATLVIPASSRRLCLSSTTTNRAPSLRTLTNVAFSKVTSNSISREVADNNMMHPAWVLELPCRP